MVKVAPFKLSWQQYDEKWWIATQAQPTRLSMEILDKYIKRYATQMERQIFYK